MHFSLHHKIVASIAIIGAAAAIAGLGTFATFTSSTSATHTIASGTLTLTAPFSRLGTGAGPIAAGDTMQRAIDLELRRHDRLQRGHADDERRAQLAARHRRHGRPPHRDRQVLGCLD